MNEAKEEFCTLQRLVIQSLFVKPVKLGMKCYFQMSIQR